MKIYWFDLGQIILQPLLDKKGDKSCRSEQYRRKNKENMIFFKWKEKKVTVKQEGSRRLRKVG
jgi:hypothetical protein